MKRKFTLIISVLILILTLAGTGCSAGRAAYDSSESISGGAAPMEPAPDMGMNDGAASEEAGVPPSGRPEAGQQKVIRNGSIVLTVDRAADFSRLVQERTEALEGYISYLSQYSQDYDGQEYVTVSMAVRIPVARFDQMITWLEESAKVEHKDISSTDVTEEYMDLEARIRNLKSQETRLQEIFVEASTVEDLLAVERELGRVRGEIESLEGRFRYLDNQVSYSTLQLEIREERIRPAQIRQFSLTEVFRQAGSAFTQGIYSFLTLLGDAVVYISYALPFLLFLVALVFVIIILSKRSGRKKDRSPETDKKPE